MRNLPDYHQKQPARRFYQAVHSSTCIAFIIGAIGVGILWSSYQYIALYPNEHLATAIVYACSVLGWVIYSKDRHNIILKIAQLILLSACLIGILQWQMMDNRSIGSIFGNRNVFSYVLLLGVVISIDEHDYLLAGAYLVFVGILGSRGAYIIVMTWLIVVYSKRVWEAMTNTEREFFPLAIVFILMLFAAFAPALIRNYDNVRIALWLKGLSDPLLFGHGIGSYSSWINTTFPEDLHRLWHAHNAIIQIWYELGVAAAIVIVGAVGILLVKLWKINRSSSRLLVIMLIVSSSVDYIYWYPGVLMVLAIVVTQHLLYSRSCQASEVDSGVSLAVASAHEERTIS